MPRTENAHDLRGRKVYILSITTRSGTVWSRPDPLPFADLETLKRHLCATIEHYLSYIDTRRRRQLLTYLEAHHYTKVIRLFRDAQLEYKAAIPLDFFWKEKPPVIM